jgi:hypothetical protein
VKRVRGRHLEIVQSASTSVSSHSFSPAHLIPDAQIHCPIATFVDVPSKDGRRVHREIIPVEPPSPIKSSRACSSNTSGLIDETRLPPPVWSNGDYLDEHYIMFGEDDGHNYEPPPPSPPPKPHKALFSVSQKQSNLFDRLSLIWIKIRTRLCTIGRSTPATAIYWSFCVTMDVKMRIRICVRDAKTLRTIQPTGVASARVGFYSVGNVVSVVIRKTHCTLLM